MVVRSDRGGGRGSVKFGDNALNWVLQYCYTVGWKVFRMGLIFVTQFS